MRLASVAILVLSCVLAPVAAQTLPPPQAVDAGFAAWTSDTPGCAIGVESEGSTIVRGYGLADLERNIAITPDTIFEAGSVAKQFTAAAILLLAGDGKLSLDDPVRKYLPELPDYGQPLTIRHMLNHTSGLRDWGSVAAVGGWPRGSRVHTHAHVLEIVSRQRRLNFASGSRWSYSNTGYNLAAMIVERVSGSTLDTFSRTRIFEPLGMLNTSWRSDHTRVVKNRAVAYENAPDGFHIDMPFENVYGNGGLLTTVGDLLKWNRNFSVPVVGDASFVAALQEPGRLTNGRPHGYALGLSVREYKGVREVGHDGATAGYTAHLVRFPDHALSIAVLCNATNAVAPRYAYEVAELYLAGRLRDVPAPTPTYDLTDADGRLFPGLYRSTLTGMPVTISRDGSSLRAQLRGFALPLAAASSTRFTGPFGIVWEFDGSGRSRMVDPTGVIEEYERVTPATPSMATLRQFVGDYRSDEAEASLGVGLDPSGALVATRRPQARFVLSPVYADAFMNPELGLIIFRRQGERVTELTISQDRMWDLRFERVSARSAASGVSRSEPARSPENN
jgi:CubicO group peptidase (beta-lactamase class C family)